MRDVFAEFGSWISRYHLFDSLLADDSSEKLSPEEEEQAMRDYYAAMETNRDGYDAVPRPAAMPAPGPAAVPAAVPPVPAVFAAHTTSPPSPAPSSASSHTVSVASVAAPSPASAPAASPGPDM